MPNKIKIYRFEEENSRLLLQVHNILQRKNLCMPRLIAADFVAERKRISNPGPIIWSNSK